jgi:hypothetical protein
MRDRLEKGEIARFECGPEVDVWLTVVLHGCRGMVSAGPPSIVITQPTAKGYAAIHARRHRLHLVSGSDQIRAHVEANNDRTNKARVE